MKRPFPKNNPKIKENNTNKKSLIQNRDEFDDPKPQKMDLSKIEKTNKPQKLELFELGDDQKNLRQKAFKMMKKKPMNKEDINKLSKLNFDNETLDKKIQETIFIPGENEFEESIPKNLEESKPKYSSKLFIIIKIK